MSCVLALTGCESTSKKKKGSGDEFYDGREKTLYQTGTEAKTTEEAFQRGQNALAGGDTDRALYEFVQAYVLDDENADALYQIGVIHAGRNNNLKAIIAFNKALKIKKDDKSKDKSKKDDKANKGELDAREWLGLLHMRQRNYAVAQGFLETVAKEDKQRWRAYNALAVIADLGKKYDSAHYYYLKALEANPGSPAILNNLGYSQYLAGDWDRAIATITLALRAAPDYVKAWHNLALIYVRQKRYDEALRALGQIMDRPHAYATIGDLSLLERDYALAEEYLLKAIKASPTYFKEAFESLAKVREFRSKPGQHATIPGPPFGPPGPEAPLQGDVLPASPDADPAQWSGPGGGPGLPAQVFPVVPQATVTGTPMEAEKGSGPGEANVSMPAGAATTPSPAVLPPTAPPEESAVTGPTESTPGADSVMGSPVPGADPSPAAALAPPQQSIASEPRPSSPIEEKASASPDPATGPSPAVTPALPKDDEQVVPQLESAPRENKAAKQAPAEDSQIRKVLVEPGGANKTNDADMTEKPGPTIMAPAGTAAVPQTAPAEAPGAAPTETAPTSTETTSSPPEPVPAQQRDTATDAPEESPTKEETSAQPSSSSDVEAQTPPPQQEPQQPGTAPASAPDAY